MRYVALLATATLAVVVTPAGSQDLPRTKCATYATMADAQAKLTRDAATEAKLVAGGGLKVNEPDAQAAFDRLAVAAGAAEKALNDLAFAWEDVQIETFKCKVLEERKSK